MKTLAALLLACFATLAGAVTLPPCYPTISGDKAYPALPVGYRDSLGAGLGWYCLVDEKWQPHTFFGTYDRIGSDYHAKANTELLAILNAPDKLVAANALVARVLTEPMGCANQTTTNMRTLCASVGAELAKHIPPPIAPPPTWIVKPNIFAGDGSRPVYPVVAGVMQTKADPVLRAPANSPCDCAVKFTTTSSTICGVLSRLDRVAVCMPAPTPVP